jgi:hypothetical protein
MALFAVLVAMNPIRIKRERRWLRPTSFGRIGPVTVANAWSAILVIGSLLRAQAGEEPGPLMAGGGAVWLTNVIAFGLWYWELDRGGPVSRAHARRTLPDFQFVQMDHPARTRIGGSRRVMLRRRGVLGWLARLRQRRAARAVAECVGCAV